MPSFDPAPHDSVTLFGEEFVVQRHPNAPDMAYAQEGGRATIFKLSDRGGHHHALKVFKPRYLDPGQSAVAERLSRYCNLPGMRAALRRVVREDHGQAPRSLDQAVIMAWIDGTTWFDLLSQAKLQGFHLRLDTAIRLCRQFLHVVKSLESCGAAHTDISAGNVVIDPVSLDVQLVDLEELFGPGFPPPPRLTGRTSGYARNTFEKAEFWSGAGDRFASTVLAAEILALSAPALAATCHGDSFFDPGTMGDRHAAHYKSVVEYLQGFAPEFTTLFERAWAATDLAGCATIAECASCINDLAARMPWQAREPIATAPHQQEENREGRLGTTVKWVDLFDPEPIPVSPPPPPLSPPVIPLPFYPVPDVPRVVPPPHDRFAGAVVYAVMVAIFCAILIAGIATASH